MQRLDERVRLLGDLRRRRAPGADRPHRLVGDHEPLVLRESRDLAFEHRFGLLGLALCLGLPHARDDRETRLERGVDSQPHGVVGLAEVLPALGMADEGSLHAELEQHRRGHLAREGTFELPVHVLGVDRDAASLAEALDRRVERHERRADDDVDVGRAIAETPDLRRELPRLVRALEHLPVARDQHRGDLRPHGC